MKPSETTSRSLSEWLAYLESIHPTTIELGLERVGAVAKTLALTELPNSTVITVAGTNGKGSTCAYIEQCLLAAGYSVGVYSSPHLLDYRERVRLNQQMLPEQAHCEAFAAVEQARSAISLSYFEFGTLAAIWLLKQQSPDVVLLEVGLGGRLDATNVVEPDVAVVTTVDIDHQAFLGDDKEQIGFEKAGIFRANKPAILGDAALPSSVLKHANDIGASAICAGVDFLLEIQTDGNWRYTSRTSDIDDIAEPQLPVENVATAIAAIAATSLTCDANAMRQGIAAAALPGRWQTLAQQPWLIADVAHNPQSTSLLANKIRSQADGRKVYAVVAMLSDKDSQNSLLPMKAVVDYWYLAGLDVPRGADANHLAQSFPEANHVCCHDVASALRQVLESASEDDMVVVFGSFYTVAEAQQLVQGNSFE